MSFFAMFLSFFFPIIFLSTNLLAEDIYNLYPEYGT